MEETKQPAKQSEPVAYTEDPFSYNFISLNKSKIDELPTPSANEVMVNPLYHAIGKSLGIDKAHDWNKMYDKVFMISEWAKERSGLSDPAEILKWISNKADTVPSLGAKKINDIYAHIRLGIKKGKDGERS